MMEIIEYREEYKKQVLISSKQHIVFTKKMDFTK